MKTITEYNRANQLYLNRHYVKAYEVYKKITDSKDDHYGAILGALKSLGKISKYNSQTSEFTRKLIENFLSFSDNIHDRTFLLKQNANGFICKYFNSFLDEDVDLNLTQKFISTISYHIYFEESNYQNIYKIFSSNQELNRSIAESYEIISEFLEIIPWPSNNIKNTQNILKEAYKYGLVTRVLQREVNQYHDTISHKLLRYPSDNDIESCLLYLSYAAKFSTSYLKKFLFFQSNRQGENWLYDVVDSSNTKLVKQFTKILEEKKIQYFALLKHHNSYIEMAANQDNHLFVKKILKSIQKQSAELEVEQRVFNLEALKFSEIYSSRAEMKIMRMMGIKEYLLKGRSYEEDFSKHKQNVHRQEFSDPIVASTETLRKHYNNENSKDFIKNKCRDFEAFFHSMHDCISRDTLYEFLISHSGFESVSKQDIFNYESEKSKSITVFIEGAEITLSRIVDSKNFSFEYNKDIKKISEDSDYPTLNKIFDNFTLQDALAYAWTALSDPKALTSLGKYLSDAEILERKLLLVNTLYTIHKEGLNVDTDTQMDKKLKQSVICNTGVFERIVNRLNQMHDLVNIKVKPKEMNITENLIRESLDSIIRDLEELPIFLLSRIYDNFDYFKQNDLSKKFIPLQQYVLGAFKKAFIDHFEYIPELNDKDFTILEKTIDNISLLNPVEEAINEILPKLQKNESTKNTFYNALVAKLVLYNIQCNSTDNYTNVLYWSIEFLNKIQDIINKSADQEIDSKIIQIAVIVSNEKFLNQDIIDKITNCDTFKFYNQIASKTHVEEEITKQSILKNVSQTMKDLSQKITWDGFDIIKFNLITSKNPIYKQVALLNDLFKHSILKDNFFMLKMVVNKLENIYEKEIASGENTNYSNPNKYCNKYLLEIAQKEFCHSFNILHLAAIYLKSNDAFDFLLNFREFRYKLDSTDHQGNTASSIAASNNNEVAVKKFIEYGADINIPNSHGLSAIHKIAANNNFDLLQYVLNHGANPFARDNSGNTFIHSSAYEYKSKETLKELLQAVPIASEIFTYFEDDIIEILGSNQDSFEDSLE